MTHIILLFAIVFIAAALEYAGVIVLQCSDRARNWRILLVALAFYGLLLFWQPPNLLLSNSIVLLVAIIGGAMIGSGLDTRAAITAFSIAASLADILSFLFGPTRILFDRFGGTSGSLITYLAISIPLQDRIVPVVGFGDLFILGAYFAALRLGGYSRWVSFAVPTCGLFVALLVGLATGGVFGIPFIAAGTLASVHLGKTVGPANTPSDAS